MFGMGPLELIIIFLAVIVLFGPDKLPEIFGHIKKVLAHFGAVRSQVDHVVKDVVDSANLDELRHEGRNIEALLTKDESDKTRAE
jgi:Sec-independent protein translocase protein TatA